MAKKSLIGGEILMCKKISPRWSFRENELKTAINISLFQSLIIILKDKTYISFYIFVHNQLKI